MSSLYRRKGSRFVWLGFTDQWGIRHTRSTKIPFDVRGSRWIIPHEAREIQRHVDREISAGVWDMKPRGKSPPISEVLASYLSTAGSNLRPNSKRCKTLAVRQLVDFLGDVPVASVTRDDLFAWKDAILKKDISPHTAASWIREISPLFRWAADEGLIDRSPVARGFKMNPPVHPPEIFTDAERDAILDAAPERLRRALAFLWETGFRIGELTNLRWERAATSEYAGYLDFNANTIWVWNEKERRYDPYPMKGVRGMLEGLPRDGEYVFTAARGGRLDPARFARELKRICRALGISGRSVHSIRKSCCSRLIRQGVDFGTVHKLMRHRDPATTMRYYAAFSLSTLEDGQERGGTPRAIPLQSPTEGRKTA